MKTNKVYPSNCKRSALYSVSDERLALPKEEFGMRKEMICSCNKKFKRFVSELRICCYSLLKIKNDALLIDIYYWCDTTDPGKTILQVDSPSSSRPSRFLHHTLCRLPTPRTSQCRIILCPLFMKYLSKRYQILSDFSLLHFSHNI